MSQRLVDFWGRVAVARAIIDKATGDGGYATLSSRTDKDEELVHWKTAEAIAERLPRVYQIHGSPIGDYRWIRNIRIARTAGSPSNGGTT